MAALAGILIGIPTLRLKGDYLAIATLGFGEIVRILGLNWDYAGGAPYIGIYCPNNDHAVWITGNLAWMPAFSICSRPCGIEYE